MATVAHSRNGTAADAATQCRTAVQAAVRAYPPRIQAMLDSILLNADNICTYSIGSLELHFKGEHLSIKLVQFL